MQYRALGRTGISVSHLTLGAMMFGAMGNQDSEECVRIAVEYGDGISERLRSAAPKGIDAFIDLFGPEYLRLAVDLGVDTQRIKTIVFSPAATELGVQVAGAAILAEPEIPAVLSGLADLLASREIDLPIAATFPLDRVSEAFEQLERRHTLGKIVLLP